MKMYMRHCSFAGGLRASGGSWYFSTVVVPATVLASLARRPVGLKFGFCFSTAGAPPSMAFSPRKESSCDGRGARDFRGGDLDLLYDLLRLFAGGELERLLWRGFSSRRSRLSRSLRSLRRASSSRGRGLLLREDLRSSRSSLRLRRLPRLSSSRLRLSLSLSREGRGASDEESRLLLR